MVDRAYTVAYSSLGNAARSLRRDDRTPPVLWRRGSRRYSASAVDADYVDTEAVQAAARADPAALLAQWNNGLRIMHIAQSRAAATSELRGRLLGVGVVVLSTIVGTAIFSTLESSPSDPVRIVAGLASVGAGVLAALQTFLGLEQRAAKHREAAAEYGKLRRELEAGVAFPDGSTTLTKLLLDVRRRWDALDATAPVVSRRLYRDAAREVSGRPAAEHGVLPRA